MDELKTMLDRLSKECSFSLTLEWSSDVETGATPWSARITDIEGIGGRGLADDPLAAVQAAIIGYHSNYESEADREAAALQDSTPE